MKQELPVNRVKRVLKQDPDIHAAQKQAVTAIGAATQLFISYFAEQAANQAQGKRIQYKHFAETAKNSDELAFVRMMVPEQQTLASVLQKRQANGLEEKGAPQEDMPEQEEPTHLEVEIESEDSDSLPEE